VPSLQLNVALVDLSSGRYVRRGEPGTLGPRQRRLLDALAARPGIDRSRAELLAEAWDGGGSDRAVDAAVRTLRRDLEAEPARPDHLITVHGSGYRFEPAAAPEPGDGLPGGLDPFFGRGPQLFAIGEAMAGGAPFVSLVGPAGVGKTRLALRFAASRRCHGLGVGRAFVELAEQRSAPGVARALAGQLEVPAGPDLVRRLGVVLAGAGAILVVLDNLEQLPADVGGMLRDWAEAAPAVRWLLTSQKPIDVPGEIVPVAPLAAASASALFVQRARALGAREELAPDAVGRICDRLDRLPLAVELAAARLPALGVAGLEARLGRSLQLLVAGARPRPARHLTLEASIRWSWDLLAAADQVSLARCSVFRGPFGPAAAAAVGASELEALVPSSLLRRREDGRLQLSLPVRAFAAARLAERPDEQTTHAAHARWFRARCAELIDAVNTPGEAAAATEAQAELPNLRAALQTLAATDEGLALGVELSRLLRTRTSRELQAELLAIPLDAAGDSADPDQRAMAEASWALVAFADGDPRAPVVAAAACERAVGPVARALALTRAGDLARQQGDAGLAVARLEAAVETARSASDRSRESEALVCLGIVQETQGNLRRAAGLFEQALAAAVEARNLRVTGVCAANLAIVARRRGDRQGVRRYRALATDAYTQLDSRIYLAELALNGAVSDLSFGDAAAARDGLLRAEQQLAAVGDAIGEVLAVANRGMAHLMLGEQEQAVACLTDGAERHRAAGMARYESYARLSLGLAHQLAGDLSAAAEQLQACRAGFEQSGDASPHAVADALLALVRDEQGTPAPELQEAALRRVEGSDEAAAARAVRVLCGLAEPASSDGSYGWMAASALRARASRR
jgi:predicted ATPase